MELVKRYNDAVASFVAKVQDDPNVIAVIVYGSVSHGTLWQKSDIDMTVVVRDQNLKNTSYGLYEDDIQLNVNLVKRSELKRFMERDLTGSIDHSFSTTSKIVYTKDESLYEYFESNKKVGKADMERSLFFMASGLVGCMYKVEKWLKVKKDITYARLHLIYASNIIAQMEVCRQLYVPTREAILQATKLNPALMDKFYYKPMAGNMSESEIYDLLDEIDKFLMDNIESIINVLNECLGDGEIKTGTYISNFFKTNLHYIDSLLDYLCDKEIIHKLSQTIRITPKSKMAVDEIAFIMPKF